jgi:MOSC domain-containing protein YiiM
MQVVSVNVGRPMLVLKDGRTYSSAINRSPSAEPVELGPEGFAGDRVSDLKHHGGPDKAACVSAFDHYSYWGERLGRELAAPSFGENLTTLGLLETQVCIGDTFRIGQAVVQVTQPRQPCFKLANKHNEPQLIRWINHIGYTGFYVRTLGPGVVGARDPIKLLSRPAPAMPVTRAMRIMLDAAGPRDQVEALLAINALSEAWRGELHKRLGC